MSESSPPQWHHLSVDKAVARLKSDLESGLKTSDIVERTQTYGPNRMAAKKRRGAWLRFLLQFHQPLIYILLVSALVTAVLGKWVDAGVIFAVTVANAFTGTLVTYGQGEGIVVATGGETELGRIADMIDTADALQTPLTRKLAHFSRLVLYTILALAAVTFAIGIARGGSWPDMFMAAIALAVGAIPEGLPAVVTITLAIGVRRMARQNAIIRNLPAVETLGSTTVICSDKTGTLTQN